MIILKRKRKDSIEAGVGVQGRAAVFKNKYSGPAFVTDDNTQILESRLGKNSRSYVPLKSSGWRHPWHTSVDYYDSSSGVLKNSEGKAISGWGAVINAGFVSGIDPVARACPPIDVGIDAKKPQKTPEQKIKAKLLTQPGLADEPLIACNPEVAKKDYEIPKQFKDLGATGTEQKATARGEGLNTQIQVQGVLGSSGSQRYVAIQYFYVSVARPTFKLDVNFSTFNPILGQGIAYNATYDNKALDLYGTRARLNLGLPPRDEPPSFEQRLNGQYGDSGQDHHLISAIYWLSQENAPVPHKKTVIGPDWIPFVRHFCFWNLEYMPRMEIPKKPPSMGVDLATAAFVGRYTIAPMATLAAQASEENRILSAAFNQTLPKGYYWTI